MNAPVIARILGLLFVIVGIAGLLPLPWISTVPAFDAPVVTLGAANKILFGIFPVNAAHDLVHVLLGAWGLLASLRFGSSVWYCRGITVIYVVLAFFGLIPLTNTLLGFAPIYGWDVALHFVVALLAAYGGFGRGSIPPAPQAASGA